eukprot:m.193878 g.193878  ORF g.193878 m.193878 type:complete len:170 (-) comp21772_c0_seq3:1481-1990(-)
MDSKVPAEATLAEKMKTMPTLLWLLRLDMPTETALDLVALLGAVASAAAALSRSACNVVVFAIIWVCYFSLYQVGQTFLWFQWDILLLESGFLCTVVALAPKFNTPLGLVRLLLFKLCVLSGVVKLQSRCPTWWNLTALNCASPPALPTTRILPRNGSCERVWPRRTCC